MVTGASGELMFSFINTLQIIYFFPTWNLNIPKHYSSFLDALKSSNINIFEILNININYEY